MKASVMTTLFCECNHALEHVGSEYVACRHRPCAHFGKRFSQPTFELVEIAPPEQTEPAPEQGDDPGRTE